MKLDQFWRLNPHRVNDLTISCNSEMMCDKVWISEESLHKGLAAPSLITVKVLLTVKDHRQVGGVRLFRF